MKSQTLGIVLGINVALACLVMQGCKAVKPGTVKPGPDPVIVETDTAEKEPVKEVKEVPEEKIEVKEEVETTKVEPLPPPPPPKPVVKPLPPQTVTSAKTIDYVIKSGETLSGIAWRHGVKVGDILAVNPGMNKNRIFAGRKIKVPSNGKAVASSAKPASKPAAKSTSANIKAPAKSKASASAYTGPTKEYVVKSGDILGKIAYANGITIRQLKELNGLKNNNLRIGQKLKIPAEKVVAKNAKVEKTDDMKAVAPAAKVEQKKAAEKVETPAVETSVVEEKAVAAPVAEEKKDAVEAPAVEATVEAEKPAEVAVEEKPVEKNPTYVVKEGEDLLSVAINFSVSPGAIVNLNNLTPDAKLTPGQVLKLPENAKPVKE